MIPILYRSDERIFESNGLGRLADCISCTVTEERNGIYECQFSYPVSGEMYDQIQEGCIIGVIHDDVHDVQPFDIYSRSAPLNGVVTFYAHHISYRLGNVILKPMTASSCAAALAAIPANTYNQCPFTFWTDKAVSENFKNEVPSAVKAILGGQQGSILDVYGKGEYQWDKWAVKLYTNRGNDNGVSIRYGVNLTNLTHDYDISANYNAVAPYWRSTEDDTVVTLPEGYILASNIPTGLIPWTSSTGEDMEDGNGHVIEFKTVANIAPVPMDLSEAFEEQPTVAQLRTEALRRLNNSEAWQPDENITVSFVDLAHTADYSSISALQRVSLCDKVSVYCAPLGVNAVKMQVIRVVFNVLTEMYDEIELGKAKVSFAQAVTAQVEEITKDMPTKSMMQEAINNATNHITGANGGHVRFIYDANGEMHEILIMDTDDINTAVKVWRWNSGGFGFSSNGYAGPYNLAMTMDGAIVADMITAGHALFNILQGGVLTLGGMNNTSGELQVLDASGNVIGTWNKDGINATAGTFSGALNGATGTFSGEMSASGIKGGTLTLGGLNNADGILTVKNSNNEIIGTWANYGLSVTGNVNIQGDTNSILNYTIESSGYFNVDQYSMQMWFPDISGSTYIGAGWLPEGSGRGYYSFAIANTQSTDFRNSNSKYVIIHPHNILMSDKSLTTSLYFSLDKAHLDYTGTVRVSNLSVSGTKNRRVTTDQYSDRLLYCYETPTPMFGDIGEGTIGEDGLCYISLDAVFAQTVVTQQYQVFLQRYGEGECWVRERKGAYFIVQGTPGLAFGWEIKAKQRDYDQLRLERADEPFTVPEQSYGADAAQYINEIRKERISA